MTSSVSSSDQNTTENEVGASIIDMDNVDQSEWDIIGCEHNLTTSMELGCMGGQT